MTKYRTSADEPRVYDLRAWKRARKLHLAQEPLCRVCVSMGRIVVATEVDHIIAISRGGDWFDGDNLQSLCQLHHAQKTRIDEGKMVKTGCDVNGIPLHPSSHWWQGNQVK